MSIEFIKRIIKKRDGEGGDAGGGKGGDKDDDKGGTEKPEDPTLIPPPDWRP